MSLTDEQRVRYARHLLLPELGEAAQLRLLGSRVRFAVEAEAGAREVAGEYLRRAGVAVVPDVSHVDGGGTTLCLALPSLRCDPALRDAAQALSGAFAAVEAIKALAGIGQPAQLDLDLLLAEEV
jgi:hypothetical protein